MAEESTVKRPRASGEVLDFLLQEFEENQNPSPEQRKTISERTNMTEKAVRIWFQNRRAKLRKLERMGKPVKSPTVSAKPYLIPGSDFSLRLSSYSNLGTGSNLMPIELNEKYCFIDCLSLSVGLWQRIKTGHDDSTLPQQLINLSPFTLNTVMSSVDLMVILLRKNSEVNYFFLAVSNNSKILFRIFYPTSLVLLSLLLDNSVQKESNELRLLLLRRPRFSVYFFNGVNSNLNQWLICDDFSEGQQVSLAFYAPGGTSTPHVLVGNRSSLDFLSNFISEHSTVANAFPSVSSNVNETPQSDFQSRVDEHTVQDVDFQIKHELQSWENTPRSDVDFKVKPPHSETNEKSLDSPTSPHPSSQAENKPEKKKSEYDVFADGETPDFFSTVQTPSSHHIGAHATAEDDHLAQPFDEKKVFTEETYNFLHTDTADTNVHPGDFIVHSPEAAQVDSYIDYGGHY